MDRTALLIRKALQEDLEQIAAIYDHAREFMRSYGNTRQWPGHYPDIESAREDLENDVLYVVLEGAEVIGTFVLIPGPDPTYGYIEEGAWRSDTPYGAVHRVASRGSGVFAAAFDFAKSQYTHIRMDTHVDNGPMRHLIGKAGFSHRGTIYVEDGTPRLAFDYLKEE